MRFARSQKSDFAFFDALYSKTHHCVDAFASTILVFGFLACHCTFAADNAQVIRLGISNYATPTANEVLYKQTVEKLKNLVAPKTLSVRYYSPGELSQAVQDDQLELVFGSSGFYRRTALKTGNRELVSIVSTQYPDPNRTDGSAIVVRADRSDLLDLEDLKGKRLAANQPFTFTGFLVPMGEIAQISDPDTFFKSIDFKGEGNTMQKIAQDVIEGKADAGFLRLCMLENLENKGLIAKGVLRVIHDRTETSESCRRSTPLYPGWTVSSTPLTSPELASEVTQTLLSMPAVSGLHWAIATNYQSVDDLYRTLKMGPYEHLRHWTLEGFVTRYWAWLLFLLGAVSALAVFALIQSELLKKAFAREKALESKARDISERMEGLQKVWAVGALSSSLAHEIRQPLASIVCLVRGLMLYMDRGELASEQAKKGLETIQAQAELANNIVEKVRSYAKTPVTDRQTIDVSQIIEQSVANLKVTKIGHGRTVLISTESCRVKRDAVELGLVITNLLKNALQATQAIPNPKVEISLTRDATHVTIAVRNNGRKIPQEIFSNLTTPFKSSKSDGLGLGLAIVHTIVESHGGNLSFESPEEGGLVALVQLPVEDKQ